MQNETKLNYTNQANSKHFTAMVYLEVHHISWIPWDITALTFIISYHHHEWWNNEFFINKTWRKVNFISALQNKNNLGLSHNILHVRLQNETGFIYEDGILGEFSHSYLPISTTSFFCVCLTCVWLQTNRHKLNLKKHLLHFEWKQKYPCFSCHKV